MNCGRVPSVSLVRAMLQGLSSLLGLGRQFVPFLAFGRGPSQNQLGVKKCVFFQPFCLEIAAFLRHFPHLGIHITTVFFNIQVVLISYLIIIFSSSLLPPKELEIFLLDILSKVHGSLANHHVNFYCVFPNMAKFTSFYIFMPQLWRMKLSELIPEMDHPSFSC